MSDPLPWAFLGVFTAAMSALFFHLHRVVEGPEQRRAKYKTGSLSFAYGWAFAIATALATFFYAAASMR